MLFLNIIKRAKVYFIAIGLLSLHTSLYAQERGMANKERVFIHKGEKAVGLSFGYDNWRATGSDGIELLGILTELKGDLSQSSVDLSGSWFVKDDLSVGVRMGYSDARLSLDRAVLFDNELIDKNVISQSFDGALTVRGYMPLFDARFLALFVEGRVAGKSGYIKNYGLTDNGKEGTYSDVWQLSAGLYPGITIAATDHLNFECSLPLLEGGYNGQNQSGTEIDEGKLNYTFCHFKPNLIGLRMGLVYYF